MPKNQKKTGRQNYDWEKIKADYVTDPQSSLKKISSKYGIRLPTVAEKSKADNWFATKKNYQAEVLSKALSKACTKASDELSKELAAIECISDRITAMLEDDKQFNKHFVEIGEGKGIYHTELWEYDKVDVKQMKDTLASLKMIEGMKRSILSIQRIENIQKHEIELERLEIEKEKLALERERAALRNGNNGDSDSIYGVVLIPEVMADDDTAEDDTSES